MGQEVNKLKRRKGASLGAKEKPERLAGKENSAELDLQRSGPALELNHVQAPRSARRGGNPFVATEYQLFTLKSSAL